MAIITLTTDFGEKDHFAGAVKGAIYSESEDFKIVDISHSVSPFNIPEAAYIVQNSYMSFPKGTVHIIGIDGELHPENRHIAVKLDGHYFVCADNGIISIMTEEIAPEKMVEINIHGSSLPETTTLDTFVKVACHLARGGTLEVIGKAIDSLKPTKSMLPFVNDEQNQIIGSVIYVDNYGNVVSNIRKKFFESVQKGRSYEVQARSYKFDRVLSKYSDIVDFDVPEASRNVEGKKMAIFNTSGHLEIAVYKSDNATVGSASKLLGLQLRDTISVNFV